MKILHPLIEKIVDWLETLPYQIRDPLHVLIVHGYARHYFNWKESRYIDNLWGQSPEQVMPIPTWYVPKDLKEIGS